jgi:hypothetical protein
MAATRKLAAILRDAGQEARSSEIVTLFDFQWKGGSMKALPDGFAGRGQE